jgi:hypothetical protein
MLIHIGYHKTGTTSLQSALFSSNECGFAMPWNREEILRDLVYPFPLSFDPGEVRGVYAERIEQCRQHGLVPVLSHERLSGYPASGGFDSKEIAGRLAETFPDSRVLIVIREQRSLLRSWYAQYVRDGGGLTFADYVRSYPPDYAFRIPGFRFEYYEYDRLISHYQEQFTSNRVLVLPFELLLAAPTEFLARVSAHIGLPSPKAVLPTSNIGMSPSEFAIRRFVHRVFAANQLNTNPLIESRTCTRIGYRISDVLTRLIPASVQRLIDRRLRAQVETLIGDRYSLSNRRTSSLIGLDLRDFGYPS